MQKTLNNIYKAGLKFLSPSTLEETYSIIVKEAMQIFKTQYGSIFLEVNGVLERVYASDPLLYGMKIRKRGYTYRAFKSMHPSVHSVHKIGQIQPNLYMVGIKNIIYVPLSYEKKRLGVITLDSKEKVVLSDDDLNILKIYGSLASLAIKKTQHYFETKQALEIRDYFISAAAHELRTPLTSIHGYTQLLQSRLSKKDTVEKKWADQLLQETNRLTFLVKELLEVNRIRAGKSEYVWSESSMSDIVQRAVNRIQYHYPDHVVALNSVLKEEEEGYIVGDYDRLLQAVYNIIENAAEYSSVGSEIMINLESTKKNVVVKIKDEGIGISQSELGKVFDSYKYRSRSREKGMGIGLYLVRHIIEKHHGVIDIKSKVNKGTVVTVKLPKIAKV